MKSKQLFSSHAVVLIHSRIKNHRACITQLELTIVATNQLLDKVQSSIHREPHRSETVCIIMCSLKRYQNLLANESVSLEKMLQLI